MIQPAKRTPTPKFSLHQGDDYLEIQHPEIGPLAMRFPNVHDKKLAAFLVKAVNSHAKLLEALKEIADSCAFVAPSFPKKLQAGLYEIERVARTAIAQAEGGV